MERRRKMKRFGFITIAMFVLLGTLSPAFAQPEKPKAPELKQEMVRLKYARPQEVQNLLRPYQNPFGQISWNPGNDNLLVISDTPETLSRILAVIQEIDVKPVDLLFAVQLVLGSEAGDAKTDEALQNDPLIAELKKLLRYKSFTLLDSNLIRTLNQGRAGSIWSSVPGLSRRKRTGSFR
jgi:type II secretory pathway component GspD/PulD (secretin)